MLPALTPVITPDAETVATLGLLDEYLNDLSNGYYHDIKKQNKNINLVKLANEINDLADFY